MTTEEKNIKLDVNKLVDLILDQPWHAQCEIVPDYMPPYPGPDTKPTVQVKHNNGTEYPAFLRYSSGPKQEFFWDVYGSDMHSVELAVLALSKAPYPRNVGPFVTTFKLKAKRP